MAARFGLGGDIIPRQVRRLFDQRCETRFDAEAAPAVLFRGARSWPVEIVNLSRSGAMVICPELPHIGEAVALQLLDRAPIGGQVRWVRDDRIGLSFDTPLE